MSTSSLIFPFIKTGDTSHHDISLETLPVLEATSIGLPNLRIEERPLPTYLSERSRPPSSVIRRNSEMSMPKDTFRLEHINTNISPISGSGSIEHHAHGDKSTIFVDAPFLPELTQIISTSNLPLSPRQKWNSIIQFLVLCWSVWLIGWNDGSTGPLLPRIQDNYQVPKSICFLSCIISECHCEGRIHYRIHDIHSKLHRELPIHSVRLVLEPDLRSPGLRICWRIECMAKRLSWFRKGRHPSIITTNAIVHFCSCHSL